MLHDSAISDKIHEAVIHSDECNIWEVAVFVLSQLMPCGLKNLHYQKLRVCVCLM